MHRVLVVGNSVSKPPPELPGIPGYPERLERLLAGRWRMERIIEQGRTLDEFVPRALRALREWRPDALVLQVGHVDCAPRPLTRRERNLLSLVRPARLQARIIRFIHDHRPAIIRWRGLKQFTPLPRFQASLMELLDATAQAECGVVILPITHVTARAEVREPFYNREIDRYNVVLRSGGLRPGVLFIEPGDLFAGLAPEDYAAAPESVHWNDAGHERVARRLAVALDMPRPGQPEPLPAVLPEGNRHG